LVAHTIAGDIGWSDWHWQGNRTNGTELNMKGVVVELRENTIVWRGCTWSQFRACQSSTGKHPKGSLTVNKQMIWRILVAGTCYCLKLWSAFTGSA